jgi:hypothetical protein
LSNKPHNSIVIHKTTTFTNKVNQRTTSLDHCPKAKTNALKNGNPTSVGKIICVFNIKFNMTLGRIELPQATFQAAAIPFSYKVNIPLIISQNYKVLRIQTLTPIVPYFVSALRDV